MSLRRTSCGYRSAVLSEPSDIFLVYIVSSFAGTLSFSLCTFHVISMYFLQIFFECSSNQNDPNIESQYAQIRTMHMVDSVCTFPVVLNELLISKFYFNFVNNLDDTASPLTSLISIYAMWKLKRMLNEMLKIHSLKRTTHRGVCRAQNLPLFIKSPLKKRMRNFGWVPSYVKCHNIEHRRWNKWVSFSRCTDLS